MPATGRDPSPIRPGLAYSKLGRPQQARFDRMSLQHEPDVSKAAWFAHVDDPWVEVCSQGPRGFAQYARLFHAGDPEEDDPENSRVLLNLEGDIDENSLTALIGVLARHTSTPQECFFGLWEGYGEIHRVTLVGGTAHGQVLPPALRPMFFKVPEWSCRPGTSFCFGDRSVRPATGEQPT
jgi:hypothetical protein